MADEKTKAPAETNGTDQDVYRPLTASERMKSSSVLMVLVGLWVSMFSINIGMDVGMKMSVGPAILATIVGYLVCGCFAAAVGLIGQKTGLPSYVIFKPAMGSAGQIIIATIMFLAVSIGSLGMQADIVARSIAEVAGMDHQ